MLGLDMTSQLIRWGLSDRLWDKGPKWCVASHWPLSPDQWLLNHQDPVLAPYRLPSTANRWPLQKCSWHILWPQPTGQSIFEWNLVGLNSEFSFSQTGWNTKIKESSLSFFSSSWKESSWIHTFFKDTSTMWNTNSFI